MANSSIRAGHGRWPRPTFAGVLLRFFLVVFLLGGCATTRTVTQINKLESADADLQILLMPPDVKYYMLTAGGLAEPHAQWTAAARWHFVRAVDSYATQRGADLLILDPDLPSSDIETEYERLHNAVGNTILVNYFGNKLPTKGDRFDWSLGPGVSAIGEKHGADYALFSFYRGYDASGGRMALSIFAAAVGVGISTGGTGGFASLVDLRTGDVVWFNKLDVGTGDLRNPDGAAKAIRELLKDMPGA
jgi:hypothetical protein